MKDWKELLGRLVSGQWLDHVESFVHEDHGRVGKFPLKERCCQFMVTSSALRDVFEGLFPKLDISASFPIKLYGIKILLECFDNLRMSKCRSIHSFAPATPICIDVDEDEFPILRVVFLDLNDFLHGVPSEVLGLWSR